jgi:hypothetical protein
MPGLVPGVTEAFATPKCRGARIPDKVTRPPSLGRGTVRFSSILHDDLASRAAAAG